MNLNESTMKARHAKIVAARFSILSNTVLVVLKLIVGITGHSVSVLSEAAHSATDLLASCIAFFSVRVSDLPADREHPYGHGKIESISSMAEALLIFGAAGYILYEAISKLRGHNPPLEVGPGIVVMGISVVANWLIARYLFRVAKETDSLALEADGEHLRTDVYTSLGVMVGLSLVKLTGIYWLDPVAAIIVAMMILSAAWKLTKGALAPLMDENLPQEELETVSHILSEDVRVLSYHKLRTRKSGSMRYIDAHILLDDNLTLLESHHLTEELEDVIRATLPNVEINLHTEPYMEEIIHQYEVHGGPDPNKSSSGNINSKTSGEQKIDEKEQ